jgi:phenylalanyl-tRNA synthetase beta chain
VRVPLEWLREFVDINVPVDSLAERLPAIGLGVEALDRVGAETVLDLEVTSNRPDCLSILGVAREVALLLNTPLRSPPVPASSPATRRGARITRAGKPPAAGARPAPNSSVAVRIDDPEGCLRFTASVIDRVRVGPSPPWMQQRLDAAGIRPINNVVDVTNYVMLEIGQPMHAFDFDRVAGHRLTVRRARAGEVLQTLDGVSRVLDDTMLAVADEEGAVSLAGIIGGLSTEITPQTTTVLLEAATWDPPTIARTARRLGVRTEASARFERGVDPAAPPLAQARAIGLLAEVCGGGLRPGLVDVLVRQATPAQIRLRPERAALVLGVEVPRPEIIRILRSLGCAVAGTRTLMVHAPTFRPDLTREEDLIEEVIRIYGYDRVPLTLPRGETTPGLITPSLVGEQRVRETLTRCGLVEVLTLTLQTQEAAARAPRARSGEEPASVVLQNPLTQDQAALRTSMLPGLLDVLATNAARRIGDLQIFELGHVFWPGRPGERPEERRALGMALMGRWRTGWNVPEEHASADFFHLRWILDALLGGLGAPGFHVTPLPAPDDWWHPGRAAQAMVGGSVVARLGEVHPNLASQHKLPHRAYLADVDLEALLTPFGPALPSGIYTGLPRFPEVERDLAAVVPDRLPASDVVTLIRDAAGPLLEEVELFDVYTGPPVPPGHRNLAYRLRLRAPDRTLTAGEAEEIMERVRIALRTRAGAQIRE